MMDRITDDRLADIEEVLRLIVKGGDCRLRSADDRVPLPFKADTLHRLITELQAFRKSGEDIPLNPLWRDLALQFDGHRMEAFNNLRFIVRQIEEFATVRDILKEPNATLKSFLSSPPLPGDQVLEERIKAIADSRLAKAQAALDAYDAALANRQHGGVAAHHCVNALREALEAK